MYAAFGRANYVVTVGQEACYIGWRVRYNVEYVPDVFGRGKRSPLKSKAKGWRRSRHGNLEGPYALPLGDIRESL